MIKTVKYVFLTAMILSLLTGCRKKAADSADKTEKDPGQATKQVKPDTPPVDEQETVKTEPVADDKTEQADTIKRQPTVEEPEKIDPRQAIKRTAEVPVREAPVIIKDGQWTAEFEAAKKKAAKEGKDLLINFSGSDWCVWCMRLDSETFSKDEFRMEAAKNFVLVVIDLPNDSSILEKRILDQNIKLKNQYHVEGFPMVYLTDAKGLPYAITGYQPGGPKAYLEHIASLKKTGDEFRALLEKSKKAQQPAEKAGLIDQALSMLDDQTVDNFYYDQIAEIVKLDADGSAGLKSKYLLRMKNLEVTKAFDKNEPQKAALLLMDMIDTLNPAPEKKQELYFMRAQAMYMMKNKEGERKNLELAIEAAPDSDLAERIKGILKTNFAPPPGTVSDAKVTTTLKPYQTNVPEMAFDGDEKTYFWSFGPPAKDDTFTIELDEAKDVGSITAITGAETAAMNTLEKGILEVSTDGQTFEKVADFAEGRAQADLNGKKIKKVRIKCLADQSQWLIVREIIIK